MEDPSRTARRTRRPASARSTLAALVPVLGLVLGLALPAAAAGAGDLQVCKAPPTEAAALQQAARLVDDIRRDLAPVEDEIRNVPLLAALESGEFPLQGLSVLIGEQYNIIQSDWSSFAQMVARFQDPASRAFFGGIVDGEEIASDLLLAFAADVLGLSEEELAAYEPRPDGQTYPSRVAWIAANADRASAGASFLVNFAVFGENMGRVQRALMDRYGLSAEETAFFGLFATPVPGFEETALEVIAAGLRRGACERDVRRSARLLQAYELDFWRTVGELEP